MSAQHRGSHLVITTLLGWEASSCDEQARAGGWGPLLGDEGSGCAVVGDGVRRAVVL